MKRLRALAILSLLLLSLPVRAATVIVTVDGVYGDLLKNVLALLQIAQTQDESALTDARIRRLHAQAPEQIRTALEPFGYYHVQVRSELAESDGVWAAHYTVKLGPAAIIDDLAVSVTGVAADDPEFQRLQRELPLQIGERLVHARYEEAKASLLRLASERGYLDARFLRHEVRVDVAKNTASIALQLESGPRYRFGEVSFDQEEVEQGGFDEDYLARFVRFEPGDPYSTSAVLALQRSLSDSGNFQWVEVRPLRDRAVDDRIPIEVSLRPRAPRQWRFGLGYGTDTGPRARVNHTRRIGRRGHVLGADVLVSDKRKHVIAGYTVPLQDPTTESLGLSARYSEEETDSRMSRIQGLTASVTTQLPGWLQVLSLNFEREDYSVGDETDGYSQLLFPALSWTRVRADDRIRPEVGSRIYLELRGAVEGVVSDTDYLQQRVGMKWVRGFRDDNRVLLRADLGATQVSDFDKLPASQRFFAGGENSIRGFGYEELGPTDSSGQVMGGKYLAVGSVELERDVVDNWSVAAFYDAGNAFDSLSEPMARGAGVGLRWNSPVGPVRVDCAWALSKPDHDFRVYIVVGPDL